jgi:5-methyltetrahydropteroyltriglutamate--homocysteine methyltransferase
MTEYVATSLGVFPLPDAAKSELSALSGHTAGGPVSGGESGAVATAYADARSTMIADQLDAGLDRVVEGCPQWEDMLAHPLSVHDTVETGGIVRYYDNNNFYRNPQVEGKLTPSGDVPADLDRAADLLDDDDPPLQVVLPGPYSLADLATDDHYGDDRTFLSAVADFLAGEVASCPTHETLFLLDPSLVTVPPGDDLAPAVPEAIDTVAAATDADVVLATYFGALDEKTYAYLMDADIDALGLDIVASDREQTVYNAVEYGLTDDVALGVADGRNTLVESAETLRERAEWFVDQVPAADLGRVYLHTNTESFYLPVTKHRAKLDAIGAAADRETAVRA